MKNENNKLLWRIYLSGCIILVLKLFLIDIDTPPWEIAQYSPIDEYYYSINAYNQYEHGNLFGLDRPLLFGNPLITNILTYGSLKVFGDNYLGLRFPSFLFGLLSFSMIFELLKRAKLHLWAQVSVLVFMVLNFTFANASYIVEPTIARICTALLSLYIIVKWKENYNRKPYQIIGVSSLVGTLFLFTYPTNAFVLLASYLVLVIDRSWISLPLFQKEKIKPFFLNSIYFGIGVFISLVIYYLTCKSLGLDLLNNSMSRSGKYTNRLALQVVDIVKYALFSLKANIFVLNPLFLVITFAALANIGLTRFKSWSITKYATVIFLIVFFIQSLFINDFPERKLVLYLPFVVLLVAYYLDEKLNSVPKDKVVVSLKQWIGISGIILCTVGVYYKYSHIDALAWSILFLGILVMGLNKLVFKLNYTSFYIIMGSLVLLPELIHGIDYHIINRSYTHKNMEMSLKEYQDAHFIGGYSMGFRGYNTIHTSVNPYYYYEQDELYFSTVNALRKNNKKDYSIDYDTNKDKMAKMGFKPGKVLNVLDDGRKWIIYEEQIVE